MAQSILNDGKDMAHGPFVPCFPEFQGNAYILSLNGMGDNSKKEKAVDIYTIKYTRCSFQLYCLKTFYSLIRYENSVFYRHTNLFRNTASGWKSGLGTEVNSLC